MNTIFTEFEVSSLDTGLALVAYAYGTHLQVVMLQTALIDAGLLSRALVQIAEVLLAMIERGYFSMQIEVK